MIEFPEYRTCRDCSLWESATNPGLPTRPFSITGKDVAVFAIGEAPGYNEDAQFKSWVGQAGTVLTRFFEASKIADYADIYLSNAGRCRPPLNSDPSTKQINACRPHLQTDLDLLCRKYTEVVIFCTGLYGVQSVTRQTALHKCFSLQGHNLSYFNKLKAGGLETPQDSPPVRVFFTYHPAMLFPGRQPGKVTAVADHFTLLLRYLKKELIPNSLEVIPLYGKPVPLHCKLPNIVCVDIETYGILKGKHQSVFHPAKSRYVDGVPYGKQIVTVAFGYKDPTSPTGCATYVYDFQKHRAFIRRWFRWIIQSGTTLKGQNIKFDVLYLQANDHVLGYLLNPVNLKLDDTLLISFLLYEQRPEKGLKELATLFGITDYRRLKVTASSGTARSAADPDLLYYNCLDVASTLALYEFSWSQIEERYGKNSTKFSQACRDMRNAILWDTIMLEQAGCAMSRSKLQKLDTDKRAACRQFIEQAGEHGVIIAGEGSEKSCREFMRNALQGTNLLNDARVKLTDKKQEISVGKDNFNLLIEHSTPEHNHWIPLQAIKSYHEASKIVTSYTQKLLTNPAEGIVHNSITYPSWYPMPVMAAKYEGEVGGTIQGRFSARKPAAQTYPPLIKKCISSRFDGGVVNIYDLSQMELRIAAWLSGDPVMIQEYIDGIDRHTQNALFFWPDADITSDEFLRKPDGQRQAGKTTNFLMIYRGGPHKLQETILRDTGRNVPFRKCEEAIRACYAKYKVFGAWQDELIATVASQGYLELITGWSRHWGIGQKVAQSAVNEIVDFPVQTISAQFLQSAHFEMEKERIRQRLRTKFILQSHDSLYTDSPPDEEITVDKIVKKYLTHPPLYDILKMELGRSVPIEYEKEKLV